MHHLRLIVVAAVLVMATSSVSTAMSDVGSDDAADTGDTGGIGGVNIGEAKDEAIDERLSCGNGGAQQDGTVGLLAVGLITLAARKRAIGRVSAS